MPHFSFLLSANIGERKCEKLYYLLMTLIFKGKDNYLLQQSLIVFINQVKCNKFWSLLYGYRFLSDANFLVLGAFISNTIREMTFPKSIVCWNWYKVLPILKRIFQVSIGASIENYEYTHYILGSSSHKKLNITIRSREVQQILVFTKTFHTGSLEIK